VRTRFWLTNFSTAGHVAFFSFISEFKNPKDFPKALFLLQICDVTMYIVVGVVVYRYAGNKVSSPALSSAGKVVSKVAYGIAIPTVRPLSLPLSGRLLTLFKIIVAGVIYGHIASKYVYVRIFRGTKHMGKRTLLATGSWALITLTLWIIAWIIAER
jgi:amino acid permease